MSKKRGHGEGAIDARGENSWRLRYRVEGRRYSVAFTGSIGEARRELRRLIRTGDTGTHIAPDKITLAQWSAEWLALLSRGEGGKAKRGLVSTRTSEGYAELMRCYLLPSLGNVALQKLTPTAIDRVYAELEKRLSPTTIRHVHTCVKACLQVALKKGMLAKNPADAADPPPPSDEPVGQVLDQDELRRLLEGFKGATVYAAVAVAIFTGVRLGELLALQWSDLDPAAKTLRIERAIERTTKFGRRLKEPKSRAGRRVLQIDDALLALLLRERETHLRLVAGVTADTDVDLSLVKLPPGALMFPSTVTPLDLTRLRSPTALAELCRDRFRAMGFAKLRFHDLRASHGTLLLDSGIAVHTVAARLGHSAVVLMKHYAKRTRASDSTAASVIGKLSAGIL